jgi:transcriptional regulator with XRE-family HTH domain
MCTSTLGDRLRKARERAKLTQVKVAEHLKITSQAVSNWEAGRDEPERERLLPLAALFRVNPLWLAFGVGEIENVTGTFGVTFRSERGRPVPRLDLATAVMERFAQDIPRGEVHTYFDCGPRTFVFDIVDRSNDVPGGFAPGEAVAIDPDEKPRPGDMVFAAMKPDERPLFRRYQSRTALDGTKYVELSPLNKDWDTDFIRSPDDGRIIGVMTEHVIPRR